MASFEDREKGFESKYRLDQELEFKAQARRNKLVGLWAAEQFGLSGAQAEEYAKSVVMADFEKPGDDDVVQKVVGDSQTHGKSLSEAQVRRRMTDLMETARQQIYEQQKKG